MSEKPLSEYTWDELLEELARLRERRAAARDRATKRSPAERSDKKHGAEVTGALGEALDKIFADDEEE